MRNEKRYFLDLIRQLYGSELPLNGIEILYKIAKQGKNSAEKSKKKYVTHYKSKLTCFWVFR